MLCIMSVGQSWKKAFPLWQRGALRTVRARAGRAINGEEARLGSGVCRVANAIQLGFCVREFYSMP